MNQHEQLLIAGIMIWWGEGTKSRRDKRYEKARSYPIEITSTNPMIIRLFLDFLRKVVQVNEEKLRVQLQIHANDDQRRLEGYWSRVCSIPSKQFNKTIVRPVGNKIGKKNGTCKVRFADKATYLELERLLVETVAHISPGVLDYLQDTNHWEFTQNSGRI